MIVKNECANPMVETCMEEGILILVHLESIIAIVPNLVVTTKDLRVDVRVEETKATIMEQ
jgi:acetylornithine/succinyldiaminopimelate/putrescine aminotransferase